MLILPKIYETWPEGFAPFGEELGSLFLKSQKLRMAQNGLFDFPNRDIKTGVAWPPCRLEQHRTHRGKLLPIGGKGIQVSLRNSAPQMAVDVLQIFRLGAVDVARQVEVV